MRERDLRTCDEEHRRPDKSESVTVPFSLSGVNGWVCNDEGLRLGFNNIVSPTGERRSDSTGHGDRRGNNGGKLHLWNASAATAKMVAGALGGMTDARAALEVATRRT
jgi:hypothetical protein